MSGRVLLLYAGGTVGMERTAAGYQPMAGFESFLLQQLQARIGHSIPAFDLVSFERLIDSANLLPEDWTRIGTALQQRWRDYSGFVLLHGTDTLAYTASALAFMLQGCDKPVIVTGSQIPLAETRNDALDNLVGALILAGNPAITEVCVYFNGRLIRGNRATKVSSHGLDAFDSPNFPWLGRVGIAVELKRHLLLAGAAPAFRVATFDPAAVAVLQTYPGMPARALAALLDDPALRGLVLRTYGAGNPPAADAALVGALANAVERGVVVVNISQCLQGGVSQGTYATGAMLDRIGVLSGRDMTLEAAFTKLHFLLGSGLSVDGVKRALAQPLCGECAA